MLIPGLAFRRLSPFACLSALFLLCLFQPRGWSQGLQPVTPIAQAQNTQVGATTQQTIRLQVTGAPTSITSFSFANSQSGTQEFAAGTVIGCVVDGTTQNAVGSICSVPVTFQPAYPGLRRVPLTAVTSGGTFYFGMSGLGQAAQVSLTPGALTTVGGTGVVGDTGDNAAAGSATLSHPARTAVDYQGNIFIADAGNNAIREIVASTGNIILLAGSGTACPTPTAACGDGGLATSASLSNPSSVAVDATGNLFIADSGDNRIRRVDASTRRITTVAGTGIAGYSALDDGGLATAASMSNPQQVAADFAGNLYIAETGDNVVRKVLASTGVITTLAGDGTLCSPTTSGCGDGGTPGGGFSKLNAPAGLAIDSAGNLYIADTGDNRIRVISATTSIISTVVGTGTAGYAGDGSTATSAELNAPQGIDVDAAGNLYISDTGNAAVRLVLAYNDPNTISIVTIAGSGTPCALSTGPCGDGLVSTGANLVSPQSAALDSVGDLYIADSGENRIRKVDVVAPTFIFASNTAGFISPDNPKIVLVTNIGNEALTPTVPSIGTNPSFPSGFSYDNATSVCPLFSPGSTPMMLPVGYGCIYGIDFLSKMAGVTHGSVTLSGNALNNPSATQSVLLTGSATQLFGIGTLASTETTPAYGDQVTLTDTINVINGIVATGTVTFYNGANAIRTVSLPASGVASLTIASLPVGTDSITANYSGDVTYAPEGSNTVVETVGTTANTATTTVLVSNPDPSTYAQTTNLTATVSHAGGGGAATGTVTFYSPGTSTAINLQATSTSPTLSQTLNLAAGTYSVSIAGNTNGGLYAGWNPATSASTNNLWTNRYGIELCATCTGLVNDIAGDAGYNTDAAALTAFQAATILNLTVDPTVQGQTVGNPYTFTLSSPQAVSFYIPDGAFVNGAFTDTSTFSDDSGGLSLSLTPLVPISTVGVDSNGVATLPVSTLPIGSDAIQAVYSGDNTYVASSSALLTQTVGKSAAVGTLTTSNASPIFGQAVTFTDTLPSANGTYPSGAVTFKNGSASIGTGTLTNGIATLLTRTLPLGTYTITAVFPGDIRFQPGTSNGVMETVMKGSGSDTLTTSSASANLGQAVTFTDTIPIIDGITPTGTVTFYGASTALGTGTVNASGVATATTASLRAGTDSITASYSGDGSYASSTSNAVTVVVAKTTGTATLTSSTAASVFGQPVKFTDTLSSVAGFPPTGTVSFYNGTVVIGTGPVSEFGVASLTITSLPVGSDTITAIYSGDTNYTSASSGPVTVVVAPLQVATTDVLAASSYNPVFGQSVTFTDTISGVSGVTPTGTVTFLDGTVALGTSPVSSGGVATFSTTNLIVGSHSITALYSGNSGYLAGTSNAVQVNVSTGDYTITATPAYQIVDSGSLATYTVSLSGAGTPFEEPVTLSASGLPAGANVSFSPESVVPGAGPSTVTMTIKTTQMQAGVTPAGYLGGLAYAALLLPLLGLRRFRTRLPVLRRSVAFGLVLLAGMASLGGALLLTGCGGGLTQNYTITVTGTSGSIQHSTTVKLGIK